MDVTSKLSEFAAELQYEDVPADVRERCRMSVLDSIGIILGAADFAKRNGDQCLQNYLDAAAPAGNASVLGYGVNTTPMIAAFANGTMIEVLDCQDSNMKWHLHNCSAIIPAALALGETNAFTWAELVPAIIAGYEVHTRLLSAVQPSHWHSGFQATGTFGTCGAATTAGRLFNFDPERMAAALGIAGFVMPVSNGDNQFKGYSIKPVHGGQAAMAGLSSAYMAQAGYRAGPLEGEPPRHHAALRILSDGPNLERAVSGLKEIWHTRDVFYKPFPIGGLIIGPIELVLEILAERRIVPDEIASVDVTSFMHAVMYTGKKYTSIDSNYVDAHLSIPYCVAVTLSDGEMTPRQLSRERLRDPKVHELAARVTVSEDVGMTTAYPELWPVEVAIRLRDGTVVKRFVEKVMWSPHRPPKWPEMETKFHMMADPIIGRDRANQAIEIVAGLKETSTLVPLMTMLRTAA